MVSIKNIITRNMCQLFSWCTFHTTCKRSLNFLDNSLVLIIVSSFIFLFNNNFIAFDMTLICEKRFHFALNIFVGYYTSSRNTLIFFFKGTCLSTILINASLIVFIRVSWFQFKVCSFVNRSEKIPGQSSYNSYSK